MSESLLDARIAWSCFARRDATCEWHRWWSLDDKLEAIEELAQVRADYPHYEIELRKVTTTEERLDA